MNSSLIARSNSSVLTNAGNVVIYHAGRPCLMVSSDGEVPFAQVGWIWATRTCRMDILVPVCL